MMLEEQISAFLDGALAPAEESDLLHILSVSPEKRAVLHSFLGMRSAFSADMRATSVPPALDAAILAAAGAGMAAGAAAATVAASAAGPAATTPLTGSASHAAGFMSGGPWSIGRTLLSILAASVLFTAGWFMSSYVHQRKADAGSVLPRHEVQATEGWSRGAVSAPADGKAAPGGSTAGDRLTAGNGAGAYHPAAVTPTVRYITRVDTLYLPAHEASPRPDTVFVTSVLPAPATTPPVVITPVPPLQEPRVVVPPSGRLEVELLREHQTTYPYIDYAALGTDRNAQNFALSAYYLLTPEQAVGVTVGNRVYSMEYYQIKADSMYLYQDQPSLWYGAGVYRYALPLLQGITPELQAQIGGTNLGPTLGARLALRVDPLPHLTFLAGVNGTMLIYRYGDRMFTSETLGLLYGLTYRF